MINLNPIKARLAAATPGPWRATQFGVLGDCFWGVKAECGDEVLPHDFNHVCSMEFSPFDDAQPNAEFVAHAKQDVAVLISEVERLRADKDEWQSDRLEYARQVIDLERKVEDLEYANIHLRNTTAIRVAAPPSVITKRDEEVERLKAAIKAHREVYVAERSGEYEASWYNLDEADRKLWGILDA